MEFGILITLFLKVGSTDWSSNNIIKKTWVLYTMDWNLKKKFKLYIKYLVSAFKFECIFMHNESTDINKCFV
jgi:hypothetical protein